MIHHLDTENLQRILRSETIPEDVVAEVELRRAMFTSVGGTGPLGVVALIDAVRHCGRAPVIVVDDSQKVDWRKMPTDGSVDVEARFYGAWMPGKFLGFVEHGTLAVRLNDDPSIKECRPDMVRLLVADSLVYEIKRRPDGDIIPPLTVSSERAADQEKPKKKFPPKKSKKDKEDVPPEDDERPSDFWAKVEADSPVWVEQGDDILDGTFVGVGQEPETLIIQVKGEESTRSIQASLVQYAGAAV